MRVGVIGSGNIGATAARLVVAAGHEVAVAIDANNDYPGCDGPRDELDDGRITSSEVLAAHLDGAHVVKAFNTMYFGTLASRGAPDDPRDERLALFVAGDDAEAKARVSELIEQIGFAAVDTGSLAEGGRHQQPGSSIYNEPMTPAEAEQRLALRPPAP